MTLPETGVRVGHSSKLSRQRKIRAWTASAG
jgi:hypothetical protein